MDIRRTGKNESRVSGADRIGGVSEISELNESELEEIEDISEIEEIQAPETEKQAGGNGPEEGSIEENWLIIKETEESMEENGMGKYNMKESNQEENGIEEVDLAGLPQETVPKTVILQVEHNGDDDLDEIDLVNVAGYMKQKWKFYAYLLVVVVCIGFAAAVLSMGVQKILGGESSASAVISFNFDGIDKGLDPNGGLFDVTKVKSTEVVNMALEDLGWSDVDVETVRVNMTVTGIMPDSVKQQISVINTVAEDAVEYYTTIEDLDYFPTRYTVTLKRCKGMNGDETRELLDAILLSYRQYFMDAYANTSVLGMATAVLDIEGYDYLQASDMISNEIDTIQDYVDAKAAEAPDFRASSTGLSFSDLSSAIRAVKRLDLNNFVSFVQANNLTKDAGTQIDYYNYQIKQYNFHIQELQTQLSNVERMITDYEKNPVIVMSNQESVTETAQTDEYYNDLLEQKISLNKRISELNTELNETYAMVSALNEATGTAVEEDYSYADSLLQGLLDTVAGWSDLVQRTTEEYFEADLYADAYRIAIPAQYSSIGGLGELVKRMLIFGGIGVAVVVVLWGISGLKEEIKRSRVKAEGE